MRIEQALDCQDFREGKKWARPITWRRSGFAVAVDRPDGISLQLVPTLHGGISWNPYLGDLTSEWEMVDVYEVLKEREHDP